MAGMPSERAMIAVCKVGPQTTVNSRVSDAGPAWQYVADPRLNGTLPCRGLVRHTRRQSDHHRQWRDKCSANGRPGTCFDNAAAESFFATLKTELLHRAVWPTLMQENRQDGCKVAAYLHRELRELGYRGCRRTVRRFAVCNRWAKNATIGIDRGTADWCAMTRGHVSEYLRLVLGRCQSWQPRRGRPPHRGHRERCVATTAAWAQRIGALRCTQLRNGVNPNGENLIAEPAAEDSHERQVLVVCPSSMSRCTTRTG
jgi:transposase InsO family protein